MDNCLYNLCIDKDIELIYTNNPIMVLSSYLEYDGERIIIAHNVFRDCNEKVARAVINYYTSDEKKDDNLEIIKEFINGAKRFEKYMIDDLVITLEEKQQKKEKEDNNIIEPEVEKAKKKATPTDSLMEMEIQLITQKSFMEGQRKVNGNILSKLSDDDVLELDITVKPSAT